MYFWEILRIYYFLQPLGPAITIAIDSDSDDSDGDKDSSSAEDDEDGEVGDVVIQKVFNEKRLVLRENFRRYYCKYTYSYKLLSMHRN